MNKAADFVCVSNKVVSYSKFSEQSIPKKTLFINNLGFYIS